MGQHEIEFSDAPGTGLGTPANQTVTITYNRTTFATGVYVPESGSLQVTISPPEAVSSGAQWRRVGTVTWLNSGATESGVPVGPQTVEFSDVSNYTKPPNQPVTIVKDKLTTATGIYTPPTGSLRVTISPQLAVIGGAQWRRVGTIPWFNSGATESGVPVGQQVVEYYEIPSWTKPANRTVTIANGVTSAVSGTYLPQYGSLQVTIGPQGAIDMGAQWRVGTGMWRNSGDTETAVLVGSQTIEFSTVSGWSKPVNQTVTIEKDKTTTATGTYTVPVSSLQVMINPPEAVSAGAQWRVDGGAWNNSGYTQTGIPVGQHMVEFRNITGWTNPGSRMVWLSEGPPFTLSVTYK